MYKLLQLANILSKFYRKELKAEEGNSSIIFFPFSFWAASWHMSFQTKKYGINERE